MKLQFSKFHGLGNDFAIIDNRFSPSRIVTNAQCVSMCKQHFGIGCDGIILIRNADESGCSFGMEVINADGSETKMCGNGVRCATLFFYECRGRSDSLPVSYTVSTPSGVVVCELRPDLMVSVDMGPPRLEPCLIPTLLTSSREDGLVIEAPLTVQGREFLVTPVSMGNPHAVVFVDNLDDSSHTFESFSPLIVASEMFPVRANAEFAQVLSSSHVKMKVCEKGAGITLACGTGACAVVVAGNLTQRCGPECLVSLSGGDLQIIWRGGEEHVYMIGPACKVFEGVIELE